MTDPRHLQSPRLEALLTSLRRMLVRQVWLHGVGTIVLAASAWLLFSYWADRLLHLPGPIRVFHTLVLAALPVVILRRDLLRFLRRIPARSGLAMMLERVHPQTADLLVSAVQLAPEAPGSPAEDLIADLVARADRTAATLDTRAVVDPRGPRRRLAVGGAVGGLACLALIARPDLASIYLQRMLGAEVRWPQRTHLTVEIPVVNDRIQVEELGARRPEDDDGPQEILVRAARGSDVPVLVHVTGVIPQQVTLHFVESDFESAVPSGSTSPIKTLLRSVQQDLSFTVTGGDDRDGRPLVRVQVLQPPDVAGVAWRVEPPAYSGLEPSLIHAPDVQVLAGSRVRVFVRPDPPHATGRARLLPEDRVVELEPAPYPEASPPGSPPGSDGSPAGPDSGGQEAPPGLSFSFVADLSLRVTFELVDDTGLPNPDPGLFGVTVVEDRRPEVLLLAPGRADMDVVAGGAVPLRVRVEDDFGLADLTWDVRSVRNPDDPLAWGELASRAVYGPGESPEALYGGGARVVAVAGTRLEVDALGGGDPLTEGQQVVLQVFATDNHEPQPNESPSAPVRLRVVSGDEYLRKLQDNLSRASERAGRLYELGRQKQRLTQEMLAAAAGDEPGSYELSGQVDVGSLVHGARRVQGDARALARDLAGVTEGLLYSRIDGRAGPLLEALDQALSQGVDRSFRAEPWRALHARYQAGQLGQADLAGVLVDIVGLALEISEGHCLEAAEALSAARQASSPALAQAALERAAQAQERAQAALDQLLVKLGEWDNFQSVLTLARDILNRQKNLHQRTRKYAEEKK